MSNKINKLTIIDLEATCWELPEPNKESEIIEIGCSLIDLHKLEIIDNRSIYVLPIKEHSFPLSPFCTELTGITTSKLRKQGKTLEGAIEELKKYYPTSKPWASWGAYDLRMLKQDCKDKNIPFPFIDGNHINAKSLFSILLRITNKSYGVQKALKHLNIPFEGSPHSGKDDAYNIAKIIITLLGEKN